jgi:very-short-patch-repair endonuclease
LNNIVQLNRWCSYCANQKLCDNQDCNLCYEKSFASHEKAKYWSEYNKIKPRYVFKSSSSTKYIFNCYCGHKYETMLSNNSDCPYCLSKKLCDNQDCKLCYEKSFASHEKAKYWSKKNNIKSREILKGSDNKIIFDCACGHEIEQRLADINSGKWCSYCSNPPKKLCKRDDCKKCFEKSFASHKNVKYWSNKNKENPRNIFLNCNNKFIFNCAKGHEYKQILYSVSIGAGCSYCVNKTEQKLFDQLIKNYPSLQQQFKVKWCKKKTFLLFDFVIPEYNIIIELDGPQHFIQISNWSSPEETNINDKYKMECANKNKYSVIRLTQEDVFYDIYDWYNELKENIEKIKNDKTIQNIYMCKNNEYDVFNDQSKELLV